jgi:hypothetical protein
MGFESFRVELRGGAASYEQADEVVRRLPDARPDGDAIRTRGSTFYTVEDGRHVIEVEVAAAPVRVSCRFTLCHPASVDNAMLAMVHELMTRLGMSLRICDNTRPEHAVAFSADQFLEFADVVREYASARRAEWVTAFGPTQCAAKTREAYERFILPKSEPVPG